jgi:hypothetical protein
LVKERRWELRNRILAFDTVQWLRNWIDYSGNPSTNYNQVSRYCIRRCLDVMDSMFTEYCIYSEHDEDGELYLDDIHILLDRITGMHCPCVPWRDLLHFTNAQWERFHVSGEIIKEFCDSNIEHYTTQRFRDLDAGDARELDKRLGGLILFDYGTGEHHISIEPIGYMTGLCLTYPTIFNYKRNVSGGMPSYYIAKWFGAQTCVAGRRTARIRYYDTTQTPWAVAIVFRSDAGTEIRDFRLYLWEPSIGRRTRDCIHDDYSDFWLMMQNGRCSGRWLMSNSGPLWVNHAQYYCTGNLKYFDQNNYLTYRFNQSWLRCSGIWLMANSGPLWVNHAQYYCTGWSGKVDWWTNTDTVYDFQWHHPWIHDHIGVFWLECNMDEEMFRFCCALNMNTGMLCDAFWRLMSPNGIPFMPDNNSRRIGEGHLIVICTSNCRFCSSGRGGIGGNGCWIIYVSGSAPHRSFLGMGLQDSGLCL